MFYGKSRENDYPTLPLPGTAAASVLLLILSVAGVQLGWFSLLMTVAAGTAAAGILLLHRTPLSLTVPPVCAAAAALSAPDLMAAIPALLILPLGFCAALAVFSGWSRIRTVTVTAAATGAVGATAMTAVLAIRRLTPAAFLKSLQADAAAYLTSFTAVTETGTETAILTEESAAVLVSYGTLLSPAILVCGLFLMAYLTTGLLRRMLDLLGAGADFLPDGWRMIPGRASAAIYAAAQIVTYLCAVTPGGEALYYAFYNVSLIFLLPLSILGLTTLFRQFRTSEALGTTGRLALLFLALMIACAGLYWILTFAAYYGVYIVFRHGKSRL